MPTKKKNKPIRIDSDTGYVCLSDIISKYKEGKFIFNNLMSDANTIQFFLTWEKCHTPTFCSDGFQWIVKEAGSNTFRLSTEELIEAGATGIYLRQARWPLIYGHLD